jgi:hypothetical protein
VAIAHSDHVKWCADDWALVISNTPVALYRHQDCWNEVFYLCAWVTMRNVCVRIGQVMASLFAKRMFGQTALADHWFMLTEGYEGQMLRTVHGALST